MSDCILWTRAINKATGYGAVRLNGRTRSAHRVAWEEANGRLVPPRMEIMHTCDVRACVNPEHLLLGTHAENMRDMAVKGRASRATRVRGEEVNTAKLTADEVLVIRDRYAKGGVSQQALGDEYGVSQFNIGCIVRRETWRHV
jgi:hypothetical protein